MGSIAPKFHQCPTNIIAISLLSLNTAIYISYIHRLYISFRRLRLRVNRHSTYYRHKMTFVTFLIPVKVNSSFDMHDGGPFSLQFRQYASMSLDKNVN